MGVPPRTGMPEPEATGTGETVLKIPVVGPPSMNVVVAVVDGRRIGLRY